MSGAGIMLLADDRPQGSVCTTNDVSAMIEELQYTLGEGPCVDAYRQRSPVAEPDLAHPVELRWSAFAGPAVDAGARAVFGFPVTVGDARFGCAQSVSGSAGTVERRPARRRPGGGRRGGPVDHRHAGRRRAGTIGSELGGRGQLPFRRSPGRRHGRRTARVPVDEALVRLRAHAFSHGRLVVDVATDVDQPAPALRRRRRRPRRPGRRRSVS